MKIYDCFMFSDENMILDIRLNVLNKYVDQFIIVESKHKHNGDIKDRNFDINDFPKFKDKITYIYSEFEPTNIKLINSKADQKEINNKLMFNTYLRENSQRNKIYEGISDAGDKDMIIVGDIDEIPNLENLNFDRNKNDIMLFKQKMFYYKLNLFYKELEWIGSRACFKKYLKSPQWLRNIKSKKYPLWRIDTLLSNKKYHNIKFINNGGWHFTNMKNPEQIFSKLNSFLHHVDFKESKLNLNDIKKMVIDKKILYNHFADQRKSDKWDNPAVLKSIELSSLPEYIIQNKEKYKDWLD